MCRIRDFCFRQGMSLCRPYFVVFHFFGRISAVAKCDATTWSCAFDALRRLPGHVSVHILGRIVPHDRDGGEPRKVAQRQRSATGAEAR